MQSGEHQSTLGERTMQTMHDIVTLGTKQSSPQKIVKEGCMCLTCEDWLVDGGVWERVSAYCAQHSREDAWRAL